MIFLETDAGFINMDAIEMFAPRQNLGNWQIKMWTRTLSGHFVHKFDNEAECIEDFKMVIENRNVSTDKKYEWPLIFVSGTCQAHL